LKIDWRDGDEVIAVWAKFYRDFGSGVAKGIFKPLATKIA
jgi:hypothetical protein